MNQFYMFVFSLLLLVPLWIRLRKSFMDGLVYAVVILLACTSLLHINTLGALPQLTIQRLVLLSLAVAWVRHYRHRPLRGVPLGGWLLAWATVSLVSLVGCVDPLPGVKRYMEFVFEIFLFFFIVATVVKEQNDLRRILRAAVLGVSIVAAMAIHERYSGVNLVDRYISTESMVENFRDVRATYRHRILLGMGMAMGWPLAIATANAATTRRGRFMSWIACVVMLAACYFAMSRGPWLAAILAGITLALFGERNVRKPLFVLAVLALLGLSARPGIFHTLFNYASATLDSQSFKGGTFQYRLELWVVALRSISVSPWRMLFGFGPAAGMNQMIDWTLSYHNRDYVIWSWDNDFAYALYQYGFVGFTFTLALYGNIVWRLLQGVRRETEGSKNLYASLLASAVAFCFMMTNVHIFACQLHYLFWTVAACGLSGVIGRPSQEPATSHDIAPATEAAAPETALPGQESAYVHFENPFSGMTRG